MPAQKTRQGDPSQPSGSGGGTASSFDLSGLIPAECVRKIRVTQGQHAGFLRCPPGFGLGPQEGPVLPGTVMPKSEPKHASMRLPVEPLPPWPLQEGLSPHKFRLRLPMGVCRSSRGQGRDGYVHPRAPVQQWPPRPAQEPCDLNPSVCPVCMGDSSSANVGGSAVGQGACEPVWGNQDTPTSPATDFSLPSEATWAY